MTKPAKLYPGHQHQWTDHLVTPSLVRCTVCDFTVPRNAAGLDGRMAEPEFARGLEPGEPMGGPGTKVWWLPTPQPDQETP